MQTSTPMQKSIYVMIYSFSGAFLMAQRPDDEWELAPALTESPDFKSHEPVAFTLPGGPSADIDWTSDEALIVEARSLMTARCGRRLEFHQNPTEAFETPSHHNLEVRETLTRFFADPGHPAAAYYLGLPDVLFNLVHAYLTTALREQLTMQRAAALGAAPLEALLLEERFFHAPAETAIRSLEIWDKTLDRRRIAMLDRPESQAVFQVVSHLEALLPAEQA